MPSYWFLPLLAQTEGFGRQHGFLDLVTGSGPVVQVVLYVLVLFSVVSWGIIFYKYRQMRLAQGESAKFIELFWDSRNLTSIHDASRELKAGSVAQVFRAGYEELVRVTRTRKEATQGEALTTELGGVDNVARAMKRATTVEITKLEKALTFLATTASTTPFIGLFGTVWGIMTSFRAIAGQQTTSLAVVAPGIAEALFATAIGLVAAIPATIFYNKFVSDVNKQAQRLEGFADEFAAILSRQIDERG